MNGTERSDPIVVIGTSNIDISLHVAHLPQSGETVLGDLSTACGGKAANQAVAAARLGAPVSLITRVGDDDHGRTLLKELAREGVNLDGVRTVVGGSSGVALVMVDNHAHTTIGVAEGVNRFMDAADLDNVPQLHQAGSFVVAEMGVPPEVINRIADLRQAHGYTFILNPAPVTEALDEALWANIDVITPNETEAAILTGIAISDDDSAIAAARRLRHLGARLGIVTLGDRGVAFSSDEGSGIHDAFRVAPVDTTGASDAFNAGLVVALRSGHPDGEAIRYGQAVAALSVTKRGAQPAMPTATEVAEFLTAHNVKETS